MANKKAFSLSGLTFPVLIAIARKRRFLTVSVISWAAIGVLTITFLLPQFQAIFSKLTEIGEQEKKFETVQSQVEALRNVDQAKVKQDLEVVSQALPLAKPVLPLVSSIERLALETQVSVSNFQVNPGSVATESGKGTTTESVLKGVNALLFQLEVTGEFERINTFFRRLDEQIPLVNIISIQFSSAGVKSASTSAGPAFRAAVSIETLYSAQVQKSGKAGSGTIPQVQLSQKDSEMLENLRRMVELSAQDQETSSVASPSGRKDVFSFQ